MSTKRYDFKFHCSKDAEIIARLDAQENKQNYIRSLILSDIAADVLRASLRLVPESEEAKMKRKLNAEYGRMALAKDPEVDDGEMG